MGYTLVFQAGASVSLTWWDNSLSAQTGKMPQNAGGTRRLEECMFYLEQRAQGQTIPHPMRISFNFYPAKQLSASSFQPLPVDWALDLSLLFDKAYERAVFSCRKDNFLPRTRNTYS